MSDPTRQERIEEFMRKSLLGEELINTQFHLFSARSSASGRVVEPRVLYANNVLLSKNLYFLDLLSSDVDPSDTSFFDLTDENEVPNDLRLDEYGYGSDSDLDEYQSTSSSKVNIGNQAGDDDDSESVDSESDGFTMNSDQLGADESHSVTKDGAKSTESDETAVQETPGSKKPEKDVAVRLRPSGSRHILIKDTAFQTWYTLLNYLYTGEITVLPLSSSMPGRKPRNGSTGSLDKPRCSAKSMYRLACKTGIDDLRDKTFSFIQNHLTEQNILKELSSSLVSTHPKLFEMELDVLHSHIASPTVVAGFPAFARRIATGELSHGAEIIVGIHSRILKKPHPVPLKLTPVPPITVQSTSDSVELTGEVKDGVGSSQVETQVVSTATTPQPSNSDEPTASGPFSAPNVTPSSTATMVDSKGPTARAPRVSFPTTTFTSGPTTAPSSAPPVSNTRAPVPTPRFAMLRPLSSTAASVPTSSTPTPPLDSSSVPSFGNPALASTSSTTTPFFGFGATGSAFGSSSKPAVSSGSTGSTSASKSDPATAFATVFAAALTDPNLSRVPAFGTSFGPVVATGEAESQRRTTFSFARDNAGTTDNQKTTTSSPFSFGHPPANA